MIGGGLRSSGILRNRAKPLLRNPCPKRSQSNRRFPYGYLVTTSPQSLTLPWHLIKWYINRRFFAFYFLTSSVFLCSSNEKLRAKSIPMVWRAVCTRPRYVFTAACWSAITSDSIFMLSSCRQQSELRRFLRIRSDSHLCIPLSSPL